MSHKGGAGKYFLHICLIMMNRQNAAYENYMVTQRYLYWVCLLICLLSFPKAAHALDVPKLTGYVNDYAGMLSPAAKATLEGELRAFEQSDSTQVVILTIPSLEGEVIEEFSMKVAGAWKIGQKGKDNGVIFTVARDERKMRIEVGKGLEGPLTDLMAGRIIDLVVKPRFKRGQFDDGFLAGVHAIIDATRGEFKMEPSKTKTRGGSNSLGTILIFGAVILMILGKIARFLPVVGGAVVAPILARTFLGLQGVMPLAGTALFGAAAGLFLGGMSSRGGRGGGPFLGGGFPSSYGGSGGGSWSDSGGGFSGGGGDFGGGGASGDW